MKITNNFSFWEFGPKGCKRSWVPSNEYQKMMITTLAENIQKLRDGANALKKSSNVSIGISSGIRTMADYYRLQGAGYNPSPTSDHFCGMAVPIEAGTAKHVKFGDTYNFASGAADCVVRGMSTYDFFKIAMDQFRLSRAEFGQVIYEKDEKVEWIHLSNAYENYFSDRIVTWLDKTPFLKSLNGGKTYTVATV